MKEEGGRGDGELDREGWSICGWQQGSKGLSAGKQTAQRAPLSVVRDPWPECQVPRSQGRIELLRSNISVPLSRSGPKKVLRARSEWVRK